MQICIPQHATVGSQTYSSLVTQGSPIEANGVNGLISLVISSDPVLCLELSFLLLIWLPGNKGLIVEGT